MVLIKKGEDPQGLGQRLTSEVLGVFESEESFEAPPAEQ